MTWVDALDRVLAENPVLPALSQKQRDGLIAHAELLVRWNRVHNLTRVESPLEVARRHWADSLAGLVTLESAVPSLGREVFDVGSGAGFPGVPAALLWPSREIVLVEAARKRASFLQLLARDLGLTNVRVENSRQEDLAPGSADAVMTRATLPWEQVPRLLTLLRPGGWLAAWAAEEPSGREWQRSLQGSELDRAGRAAYRVRELPVRAVLYAQRRLGVAGAAEGEGGST